MKKHFALALAATALIAVAGCGDDGDSAGSGGITVENQWARTSPTSATNGAAYMDLTSEDGDRLVSASVEASVAGVTQIHETVMAESSDTTVAGMDHSSDSMAAGGDTTMAGMGTEDTMAAGMTMREVDGIDLPAGTKVSLAPGGYHIMLMELAEPLEAGTSFVVTLTFEQAGEVEVTVPVRDDAP